MNRRHFIHALMLTTGAASVAGRQFWKEPKAIARTFKHQAKSPLTLALTPGEQAMAELFKSDSTTLHMFGGPVLARVDRQNASWVNFLVDSRDFHGLKGRLFKFGVEPVSTPGMPGSFIKFVHQERIYNVMNCPIEDFCQMNHLNEQAQAIPFAHNFLIYDCRKREVTDPFNALAARGKRNQREIKMVSRPRSVPEGFDCVLSGRFETSLLGLRPSEELQDFERFILNCQCDAQETPYIVERAVNYLPDALEILGEPAASRIAMAPLVEGAIQRGLKVEIGQVWSAMKQRDPDERPAAFIGLIKEHMGIEQNAAGFDDKLTIYLARHGFVPRRSDLDAELMMSSA